MGSVPYFPAEAILEFLHADRLVECAPYAAKLHVPGCLNPVKHLTQKAKFRNGEMGRKHPQKPVKLLLSFRGGDGIVHGVDFLVGCYTALL